PTDLAQGAFDRERVRVLFDQLEFRTLLPRFFDAVGDTASRNIEAETLEVDVTVARDATAAAEALRAAANGDRVAIEPRWEGHTGVGMAVSPGREAVYIAGDLLGDASVRDALTALAARASPPLVAHRAKELAHGLALELQSLHHDTAVMAYLLDPGEGKY